MNKKRDYTKYGIIILILLTVFIGSYIYEGLPGRLNNRAWGYVHPDDADRDVSQWIYKFEIKDFRKGGGHDVFNFRTNEAVSLNGHKVYMVVFKTTHADCLGDTNVYFDFYTRRILGSDPVL